MASLAGRRGNSGVAALEFSLIVPMLVVLFVGVADFSVAYHSQMELSSALAAGAQFAFTKGQSEAGTTLTSDIAGFVNNVAGIRLTSVVANTDNGLAVSTLTYSNGSPSTATSNNGTSATSCYCVSGSPAVYSAPQGCGTACTDGSGSTAGQYVAITGQFVYSPMFVLDRPFFPNSFSQTVMVRLK